MNQKLNSFVVPEGFRGRSALTVQLWWLIQASFFKWSPQFLYGWRRFLLRLFGAEIGKNVIIRPTVKVTYPWKVKIGDNSWVGDYVELYSLGEITIGKDSVISQKSYLCTGSHDYLSSSFDIFSSPITIGNGVWVATDVYIAPGVTIEDDVLVGARSSVFKNLAGNYIYLGSPAEAVKKRYEGKY